MDMNDYKDILDMNEKGLCQSCSYGFAKCITDGKAFCKKEDNDEKTDI